MIVKVAHRLIVICDGPMVTQHEHELSKWEETLSFRKQYD